MDGLNVEPLDRVRQDQPRLLKRPLEWRKPRNIFVNSMSDLFRDEVPLPYILQVFDVNANYVKRIARLRATGAHVKFLSLEPLLGPLPKLDLRAIDWAIVGGESGPGARPVDPAWVTGIRDQCLEAGVAFFFKQWGGVQKKKAGRELEGRTWNQMPELRVIP